MYVCLDHKVCSGPTQSQTESTAQRPTEETPHPHIQERYSTIMPHTAPHHKLTPQHMHNPKPSGHTHTLHKPSACTPGVIMPHIRHNTDKTVTHSDTYGVSVCVFYRWCLWCVCNLSGWIWGERQAACATLFTWLVCVLIWFVIWFYILKQANCLLLISLASVCLCVCVFWRLVKREGFYLTL